MRSFAICVVLLIAVSSVVGGLVVAQGTGSVAEGQVLVVQENTLFIRTASGEPLAFNPMLVLEGNRYVPAKPARTILPALECGETVRVSWVLDEREEVRRIREIQVTSARSGITKGRVLATAPSTLLIRPKDEPGSVTLNPRPAQVNGRWVPDPVIAEKLARLAKGAKVTVRWEWDNEGRKRILALEPSW